LADKLEDKQTHLGDGVYIEDDVTPSEFILFTWDGFRQRDTIYLDQDVVTNLIKYIEEKRKKWIT